MIDGLVESYVRSGDLNDSIIDIVKSGDDIYEVKIEVL